MNILSITFHVEQHIIPLWENFMQSEIVKFIKNNNLTDKYILSKLIDNTQENGKNYNMILHFKEQKTKNIFDLEKLPLLREIIQNKFPNQEIIIFVTNLDILSQNF